MLWIQNILAWCTYLVMGWGVFAILTGMLYVATIYFAPFIAILFCVLLARAVLAARRRRAWSVTGYVEQAVRQNLPLPTMLRAAARGERGRLAVGLTGLASAIEQGDTVGEAMARHTPEVTLERRRWVAAAEKIGRLGAGLASLRRRELANLRDRRGASSLGVGYAASLASALALGLAGFAVLILPKYIEIFDDFDVELPQVTLLMMAWANTAGPATMVGGAVLMVGVTVGACLCAILRWSGGDPLTTPATWLFDVVRWRLPLVASITRHCAWARGFELTAEGLEAGQPLPSALRDAGQGVGPRQVRQTLESVAQRLEAGEGVAPALSDPGLPRLARGMLHTGGPGTGLVDTLRFLVSYHDERHANAAVWLRALVGPLLLSVVMLAVAWFAVALLYPLVTLIQSVTPTWGVV